MSINNINKFTNFLKNKRISYQIDASLTDFTTFRLGGICPCLVHCRHPDQLITVIQELVIKNIPYLLIGGGSNLLVSDEGLPKIVVRYVNDIPEIHMNGAELTVSAAAILDDLVKYSVNNGLDDFVNCSGIPGTIGGAIVGNAGAFGWQIGDSLLSVRVIDKNGEIQELTPLELEFKYRYSQLKINQKIVVDARLKTTKTGRTDLSTERNRILALRASKHPDLNTYSCAGSFFKNIEPTSAAERRQAAGWFLEEAGVKSMKSGGAGIFEKHANIIIQSSDNCKAQDVYNLSAQMMNAVRQKFNIQLEREVQIIGSFKL